MLIYNLNKAAGRVGRKEAGREEETGLEEEASRRLGNLEQVFVELGVQHGHFRLDIFVQNQRKHGKHGIDLR